MIRAAKTQNLIILCAPPGSELRSAIAKVKDSLEQVGKSVGHEDVEDTLCALDQTSEALKLAGFSTSHKLPSMREITSRLARTEVIDLWMSALRRCYSRLESSSSDIKMLSCHLTCYGGKRSEIYSVVAPTEEFKRERLNVSHVLILIDDVFDMFSQLSEQHQLYDNSAMLQDYLWQKARDEGYTSPEEFTDPALATLVFQWRTNAIRHLLAWRRHEIIRAEDLTRHLNAKFMILGIKHEKSIAARFLTGKDEFIVYLSHPITRFRRLKRSIDSWNEEVFQINEIPSIFLNHGVTTIMPTAIDENRFTRGESLSHTGLAHRSPALEERWPLVAEDVDLLYTRHKGGPDHRALLIERVSDTQIEKLAQLPDCTPPAQETSPIIRSLEDEILRDISSRDHSLVTYTDGLLVFRPLDNQGMISGGVDAELEYCCRLMHLDNRRRVAFIHFEDDVKVLVNSDLSRQYGRSEEDLNGFIVNVMQEVLGLNREVATQVFGEVRGRQLQGIFPSSVDAQAVSEAREKKQEIITEAKIRTLTSWLKTSRMEDAPEGCVDIWVLRIFDELQSLSEEISNYLRLGQRRESNWEGGIHEWWPNQMDQQNWS